MNLSLFLVPPASTIPWQRRRFTSLQSTFLINRRMKMSAMPHRCFITAEMDNCVSGFERSKAILRSLPVVVLLGFSIVLYQPVVTSEARAFDWFGISPAISKDPVEPFTLYGSIFKKYFLENIVDGKVVSRKKGFTSTACVNALDANKETPELQGIPAGLKVVIIGEPLCSKSEGQSREETCMPACRRACIGAINRHLDEVTKETGYVLDSKDTNKVVDSCSSQCTNECLKPGKTTSFIYPFRPSR